VSRSCPPPLSYRDAGVDIDRADELIGRIKSLAAGTPRTGVLGGIGGFGGLFELPLERYRHPVLVSGTDGVGTKLRLAIDLGIHDTVGIDLVAMCVNDILVLGAEPLFFLDYFATARLDVAVAEAVVRGISRGCEIAGMALLGGETAELPGMYAPGDYDLAGFCVGVVEKARIIDSASVRAGDVLLGIASSGPHSNGYSLIRKVLERSAAGLEMLLGDATLGEILMAPTRIYAAATKALLSSVSVHAMAHITGGGLLENIPRVLPNGLHARMDLRCWQRPPVFRWLQEGGQIDDQEMLRTFNCGLGMVVCVAAAEAEAACRALLDSGEKVTQVGHIVADDVVPPRVIVDGLAVADG